MKNYKRITYSILVLSLLIMLSNKTIKIIEYDEDVVADINVGKKITTSNGIVTLSQVTYDEKNYYITIDMFVDNTFETNEVVATTYLNDIEVSKKLIEGKNTYSIPTSVLENQDVFSIVINDSHTSKKLSTLTYYKTNFIFIEDLTDYKEDKKTMAEMDREVKYFIYLIDEYKELITDDLLSTYAPKSSSTLEEKYNQMVIILDLMTKKNLEYEKQIKKIKESKYALELKYYLTDDELNYWNNLGGKTEILNYFDYVTVIQKLPSILKAMIGDQETIVRESKKATQEELEIKDQELSDIDYYIYLKTLNS